MARLIYPALQEPVPFIPEVITSDKWGYALAVPYSNARQVHLAVVLATTGAVHSTDMTTPERVSLDKWLLPLNLPVRLPPRLRQGLELQLAFVKAVPFAESVDFTKWSFALSTPVRVKQGFRPGTEPELFLVKAPPFGEEVKIDKYLYPLAVPVRKLSVQYLAHELQTTLAMPDWPEIRPEYFMALTEPKRRSYRISTTLGTSRAPQRSELVPKLT